MAEFSDTYNLKNLIRDPTCNKNPEDPCCIILILINRPLSFQSSSAFDTGL